MRTPLDSKNGMVSQVLATQGVIQHWGGAGGEYSYLMLKEGSSPGPALRFGHRHPDSLFSYLSSDIQLIITESRPIISNSLSPVLLPPLLPRPCVTKSGPLWSCSSIPCWQNDLLK